MKQGYPPNAGPRSPSRPFGISPGAGERVTFPASVAPGLRSGAVRRRKLGKQTDLFGFWRAGALLALAAGVFVASFAVRAADDRLSLEEIWALGLKQSPEWVAAGHDLEGTRFGLDRARAERGPGLSLLSRVTSYSAPHRIRIPAGVIDDAPREFDVGTSGTYQVSMAATQDLYTGGATTARIAIAGAESEAGTARQAAVREDLVLALTRAAFDVRQAAKAVSVATEERAQAEAHRAAAQELLANHLGTRLDVLGAEVRLSEVERRLLSVRRSTGLARAKLNLLLGRPLDSPVDLDDAFPFGSARPPLEECRRLALASRPEIAQARGNAGRSRGQLDLARSLYRPKLSLFGTFTQGSDPAYLTTDSSFWSAGVTLTWNLWDSGRRAAERGRASATASSAETRVRVLEDDVALQVQAAWTDAEVKEAALLLLESSREAAREGLRLATERFSEGLGRGIEVLDAQTLWARTETGFEEARLDIQMARAQLLHAMGVLSSSLEARERLGR